MSAWQESCYIEFPTYEPSSCQQSRTLVHVWGTLSHVCILYKCLCFCVLYCTVLYRIHYSIYQTPIYLKASIKSVVMLCSCISYCWWSFSSTISHLLPLPQSATLSACSLDASPCMSAVVLYHYAFQGTVGFLKFYFFVIICFYVLFVWKVLSTYYGTVLYSQLC